MRTNSPHKSVRWKSLPLEPVRQLGVVQAHQLQSRRLQVVNRNWILDDVVAHIVDSAKGIARPDAASRQPRSEGAWMIAAAKKP